MDSGNQDLYLPEFVTIIRESNSVMIRRHWFGWRYVPPAVLLVIIGIFLAPPYVVGVIEQGSWYFLVVLAPWFLYVMYYWLTKLINSSYISINKECIDINHKPLPYSSNIRISTNNITHIEVEQKRYKGRGLRKYFEVSALTNNGGRQKLLCDIDIEGQAAFIKYEIEKFLNP
jgi:hypothetical protein